MANVITHTELWIADSNLKPIARLSAPYPLDKGGDVLQYSKELSNFGSAKFRISAYDNTLSKYGDIFVPHQNWVLIKKGGATIWHGAIVDNPKRTRDYLEVVAVEPLFYLSRCLIKRSSPDPAVGDATATSAAALNDLYRIFGMDNNGHSYMGGDLSMSAAVTSVMNETITKFKGTTNSHTLANLTLGTIQNPNYPPNMTNGANPPKALTGPWQFGNGLTAPLLQYDFQTVLYMLQQFGIYTYADFEITDSLVFNFWSFKGQNLTKKVVFNWGGSSNTPSNIIDYNVPRLGRRMATSLYGIAADPNGNVLHFDQSDTSSLNTYGLLEAVAAYSDVRDQSTLSARIAAEIPMVNTPSSNAINVVLNENGVPLGVYDVGDVVWVSITNKTISFNAPRRVAGVTVRIHNTGRETTTVQLNTPQPWQLTALGIPV